MCDMSDKGNVHGCHTCEESKFLDLDFIKIFPDHILPKKKKKKTQDN